MSQLPTLKKSIVTTPVGKLHVAFSEEAFHFCLWDFEVKTETAFERAIFVKSHPLLTEFKTQVKEYFAGFRKDFDLPLNLQGTPFQVKAWQTLSEIPYGKTFSYADQAKKMKAPKAVRAVGTANSKNPICLIIPCHRVTRSDGTLGGYAGGIQIKQRLLELESKNY